MRSRIKAPGITAAIATLGLMAFAPLSAVADSTIIITPINAAAEGWVIPVPGNGVVAVDFNGPADLAGGNSSLRYGPIGGAAKIEIQPPEVNFPVANFGGMQFNYQILSPAASGTSQQHVYVNAYVDLASNGLGTTGSTWYDCRYTYVAQTGALGWNTLTIAPNAVPNSVANPDSACATTLDANVGNVMFFRINGGATGNGDMGLSAAYDLVKITLGGNATTYDFEVDGDDDGIPDTAAPTTKDQCKNNGWKSFNNPTFKNQGDCVSYVSTNGKNPGKG